MADLTANAPLRIWPGSQTATEKWVLDNSVAMTVYKGQPMILDISVDTVAMRIHRDDCWEVFHFDMPHRFRDSKLEEVHTLNVNDTLPIVLCSAANRIQVNGAVLFQCAERFCTHPSFSDHSTQAELHDDVSLIRLFAAAGCGTCGIHEPLIALLECYRTTVVQCPTAKINRRIVSEEMMMQRITACVHCTIEKHHVANYQAPYLLFRERSH